MAVDEIIERRIIIGLIVSTEYLSRVNLIWKPKYLQSEAMKRIAAWCFDYYQKYQRAPKTDLVGIYAEKLKQGTLPPDISEEIEEDILPGLNEEYEESGEVDYSYLYDQTVGYFRERGVQLHIQQLQSLLESGNTEEAETSAMNYAPQVTAEAPGVYLGSEEAAKRIRAAFSELETQSVIRYTGALGAMWNDQLVRGSFVGLMGREKIGKTFRLLDMAVRGLRCGSNVAFLQGGDMTEPQQLKRIGVYLSKRSDKERYCGKIMVPVRDCVLNQTDECTRPERESNIGVLMNIVSEDYYQRITARQLWDAVNAYSDEYAPCYNCKEWMGTIWYKPTIIKEPLNADAAITIAEKFCKKNKGRFWLSTHFNGTLSVSKIRALLDVEARMNGFIPDIVIVDYADILAPEIRSDFRHQQNDIWQQLRALSQERQCLVVTATQVKGTSYNKDTLSLSDYSEDKRKYAHATAMYGLNQDKNGREKAMGLMRINELVVREDDFSVANQVYVMQCLPIGRPFLGSFKKPIMRTEGGTE